MKLRLKIPVYSLLIGAMLLTGCVKPDQVSVGTVETIRLTGVGLSNAGLEVDIVVENTSGKNIVLSEGAFWVERNKEAFLHFFLRDDVVIPKKSDGIVTLPILIRFNGISGALAATSLFDRGCPDCLLSGEIKIKAGLTKKKFKLNAIPLKEAIQNLDINADEVIKDLPIF